jgi:Uma2 family endonuclease
MATQTQLDELNLAVLDLDEDDDDDEPLYYFYDDEENFAKLRLRDMPGSPHELLNTYLRLVLDWYYHTQDVAIYRELNFYETTNPNEEPLYPDIAVLKGQVWQELTSYRIGEDGCAPHLVIELISKRTRKSDLEQKPKRYAKWRTEEYFAYDNRGRRRNNVPRLVGWRLNASGTYDKLATPPEYTDGRLWSEQLNCWLVPDRLHLRLFTAAGEQLLTQAEANSYEIDYLDRKTTVQSSEIDRLRRLLEEAGIDPDVTS